MDGNVGCGMLDAEMEDGGWRMEDAGYFLIKSGQH